MFFSGMVLNEEKNEVLVIQDKHQVTLLLLKHFLALHNFLKTLVTPSDLIIILLEEAYGKTSRNTRDARVYILCTKLIQDPCGMHRLALLRSHIALHEM